VARTSELLGRALEALQNVGSPGLVRAKWPVPQDDYLWSSR
jgi:hypothetical protein